MSDLKKYDRKLKMAKAKFWRTVVNNPLYPKPEELSLVVIARVAGQPSLANSSLTNEDTYAWFMDNKHNKDMLEAGSEYAIGRLIDIILDTDAGPKEAVTTANQVAAAKILLDMAGYSPQKSAKVEFKDKEIGDLDEDQLEEFIRKRTKQIEE